MLVYLSLIESDADKTKFEILYIKYRQTMYHTACRILGDEKDSEDVVHQAFLKVIDILDKISDPQCPKTRSLLVTIVERKAIDLYRRRQRSSVIVSDEECFMPSCSETESISESSAISESIARLPVKYRQLLLLKYDNGFSDREIAGLMDMSEDNVRKTIQRAKAKLSADLKEQGVMSNDH